MFVIFVILLILFVSAIVAVIGGPAYYMLGPLDAAAKNRRCAVQFTLADFLAIFVLMQLVLGGIHYLGRLREDRSVQGEYIADIIAGLFVVTLWWITVRTLSRAGIHKMQTRILMLLGVIPLSYVTAILFPMPAVWLIANAFGPATPPGWILMPLAAQAVAVVVTRLLRMTVLSVLAAAQTGIKTGEESNEQAE